MTFIEEYEGAVDELNKSRFKNSAILFSKAFFALCDWVIYQKLRKLPKNHAERFRILEEHFVEVYQIADLLFAHYTDAYSKPVLKETCLTIKNGIQQIIRIIEVPGRIKAIIER